MDDTLDAVEGGARYHNRLTVDSGIVDVLQDHFAEVVDGMDVDYFPEKDFEILQTSGSLDARREVTEIILHVKSHKEQLLRAGQEVRFSQRLKRTAELIYHRREPLRLSESVEEGPPKPPAILTKSFFKWFFPKCLGALLGIGDILAFFGVWGVPSPDTIIGAMSSVTAGVVMLIKEEEPR